MTISLGSVQVSGKTVRVTASGFASALFGKYLGISGFSASLTSAARAATGISSEW
jgi:hypothetical protein